MSPGLDVLSISMCLLTWKYSITPHIRIADYPDQLGPCGEHFPTVNVTTSFIWLKFSPVKYIITNYVLMLYLYVNKYVA